MTREKKQIPDPPTTRFSFSAGCSFIPSAINNDELTVSNLTWRILSSQNLAQTTRVLEMTSLAHFHSLTMGDEDELLV